MANEDPSRSPLGPAVLVGIGVASSLDEIVLHQLLRWHHFYDRNSQAAGLIADGIFHLGSTATLSIGLVLLVQRWRTGGDPASTCMTAPIRHKLLGLHQVRAGVPNNLPYDPGVYRRGRRDAAGRVAPAPGGQFADSRAR